MMTLDQLVDAFEAGVINAKTLVTEVGGSEWKPLSEVADLGDDEEEAAPQSVAAPPVHQSYAPSAPVARAASVGPAAPSYPPAVSRAPQSAWPPVVSASRAPASYASQGPITMPPNSTMPVVADLSIGLDDDFKPRRSKAPFVMAAVVVLLVGGALGATRLSGGGEIMAPVPVPAAAPAPLAALPSHTETTTTSTPAPTPPPAAAPTTDSSSEKSKEDSRLADDVKSKLKEADKTRADKKKASKASRSAPSRSKGGSSSKEVFRKGGNANDPLNSSL
jgi:hypothetical protein